MRRPTKVVGAALAVFLLSSAAPRSSPQAVVQAKFAAVNRHAVDDIALHYANDAVLTASDFCSPRHGRAEVARTYRAIFAAFPSIRADVVEYVVQGDRVAARVILHVPANGRTFDVPLMNFFTVRQGKIVRDDGIFDNRGQACKP